MKLSAAVERPKRRAVPSLAITKTGTILVDGAEVEHEQLATKFKAGDSVSLRLSELPKTSQAREAANRVYERLLDAGVEVDL